MICDFCGVQPDLNPLYFQAEEVMTWCGVCRAGSREYFIDETNDEIMTVILVATEVLKTDPIRGDEEEEILFRKMNLEEEIERCKSELVFRVTDVQSKSQQ